MKVTPEHNADCKRLLKLMGVPFIDVSWNTVANFSCLSHFFFFEEVYITIANIPIIFTMQVKTCISYNSPSESEQNAHNIR